jgi:ribosome-associated protein
MDDIVLNSELTIQVSALSFKYSRSGGKGGQNVNKVSTKVEMLVNIEELGASDEIKAKLKSKLNGRINSVGLLRIVSQESRSQWQNRRKCVEKLIDLLNEALEENPMRFATKPTYSSRKKRLKGKEHRSTIKQLRKKSYDDE